MSRPDLQSANEDKTSCLNVSADLSDLPSPTKT